MYKPLSEGAANARTALEEGGVRNDYFVTDHDYILKTEIKRSSSRHEKVQPVITSRLFSERGSVKTHLHVLHSSYCIAKINN